MNLPAALKNPAPYPRRRGPFHLDDKVAVRGKPGVYVVESISPSGKILDLTRPATGETLRAAHRESNSRWVVVGADLGEYLTRVP